MIIMGYPGVGKTHLVEFGEKYGDKSYVDLRSEWFTGKNGTKSRNWALMYAKCAEGLSKQGFVVLISTHAAVQIELTKTKEYVMAVFPSKKLKEDWLVKLRNRWMYTKDDKDYRAYRSAADGYDEQIDILMDSPFEKVEITHMNYELSSLLVK